MPYVSFSVIYNILSVRDWAQRERQPITIIRLWRVVARLLSLCHALSCPQPYPPFLTFWEITLTKNLLLVENQLLVGYLSTPLCVSLLSPRANEAVLYQKIKLTAITKCLQAIVLKVVENVIELIPGSRYVMLHEEGHLLTQ